MRIVLNLATRPFADQGPAIYRLRIACGVLAVVAIGLGAGVHALDQKAQAARAAEEAIQNRIHWMQQERQGYQELMRQPANADLLVQAGTLNQLFDEKAFSWTLAMEDLETVLPGGVQVTTIEPSRAKDGHITLRLRVIGPRDKAVDLVSNLEHSKHFLLPRITGESAESSGGGANERLEPISLTNKVNFDLLAEYNPGAAGEARSIQKAEKSEVAAERQAPVVARPQPHQPPRPVQSAPLPQPHIAVPQRPVPQPIQQPMQRPGFPLGMPDAMLLRHHGIPQPNAIRVPNAMPNAASNPTPKPVSGGPQ